ncbi:potassium channel family protein [Salimicrobium halophilum]|uniref:Potassium channel LctB n=1 Tax=Salimicrobium halophilum TaxID=86666 RepID=A0A1G8RB80_9BACI|nr:potassium channel family protein [Salimicrobium halophilum]SDJ14179.1 potassium channel LctB [Salimicrobium halophilum]
MNERRVRYHRMTRLFVSLFLFYTNVIVMFALIYILLDASGVGPVVDHYRDRELEQAEWPGRIGTSLYFSVITLFSVGYGDVTPFGWSRIAAIIESAFGYILPAVLMFPYVAMMKEDEE